jgi:hypothetical protein
MRSRRGDPRSCPWGKVVLRFKRADRTRQRAATHRLILSPLSLAPQSPCVDEHESGSRSSARAFRGSLHSGSVAPAVSPSTKGEGRDLSTMARHRRQPSAPLRLDGRDRRHDAPVERRQAYAECLRGLLARVDGALDRSAEVAIGAAGDMTTLGRAAAPSRVCVAAGVAPSLTAYTRTAMLRRFGRPRRAHGPSTPHRKSDPNRAPKENVPETGTLRVGATGLEPATSGVTGHFEGHDDGRRSAHNRSMHAPFPASRERFRVPERSRFQTFAARLLPA